MSIRVFAFFFNIQWWQWEWEKTSVFLENMMKNWIDDVLCEFIFLTCKSHIANMRKLVLFGNYKKNRIDGTIYDFIFKKTTGLKVKNIFMIKTKKLTKIKYIF